MTNKIDWISFSFKRAIGGNDVRSEEETLMWSALEDLLQDTFRPFIGEAMWEVRPGRAPYEVCYHHQFSHLNLFWHTRLDHALVELSGGACDWLIERPWHRRFLELVTPRLTRVDLARDIKTNLDPVVFASHRDTLKFRSHSEFISDTGTTAYVGSRTSNRYARVYRYNEPHPRHKLLRVEMVSKAEDAKLLMPVLLKNGIEEAINLLGAKFGWSHPLWGTKPLNPAELATFRPERRQGKTVFWLADTVAPLLLRLENEGVIDIDEWIADHIAPKRKPK